MGKTKGLGSDEVEISLPPPQTNNNKNQRQKRVFKGSPIKTL